MAAQCHFKTRTVSGFVGAHGEDATEQEDIILTMSKVSRVPQKGQGGNAQELASASVAP